MIAPDLFGEDYSLAVERLHAATALYTAEPIVDSLLDRISWPCGGQRFIDPSCGDGVFLRLALRRLLRRMPHADVLQLVQGWEIHPGAAASALEHVRAELAAHGVGEEEAHAIAARIVHNRDFLTDGPGAGELYDVVAGNPPYLRYAHVPPVLRSAYEPVVAKHARADLLHAFLDRCAALVKPGGSICLVTADRWLFNSGAAQLRAVVGERLSLVHLARLDAASAFYRPKVRRAGTPPRIHPVEVVLRRDDSGRRIDVHPIYPGAEDHAAGGPTLGAIARVRLGPWLGASGIFVVDSRTAEHLDRENLVPAIDTDDLTPEDTLKAPTRFAIRTTVEEEPRPAIAAHLRRTLTGMAPRGRRDPFWLPPESWGDLPLAVESLVIPRIAKRLRAVLLPPGVLPISHNLSVVSGNVDAHVLARALHAKAVQEWIQQRAARLENGYLSITPRLLRSLPVTLLDI